MRISKNALVVVGAIISATSGTVAAQVQPDRALLAEIRAIRAVDNHSHLPGVADAPAVTPSPETLGRPPFTYPVRLRVDNPEWAKAWSALYGVKPLAVNAKNAADVLRRKDSLAR